MDDSEALARLASQYAHVLADALHYAGRRSDVVVIVDGTVGAATVAVEPGEAWQTVQRLLDEARQRVSEEPPGIQGTAIRGL